MEEDERTRTSSTRKRVLHALVAQLASLRDASFAPYKTLKKRTLKKKTLKKKTLQKKTHKKKTLKKTLKRKPLNKRTLKKYV